MVEKPSSLGFRSLRSMRHPAIANFHQADNSAVVLPGELFGVRTRRRPCWAGRVEIAAWRETPRIDFRGLSQAILPVGSARRSMFWSMLLQRVNFNESVARGLTHSAHDGGVAPRLQSDDNS